MKPEDSPQVHGMLILQAGVITACILFGVVLSDPTSDLHRWVRRTYFCDEGLELGLTNGWGGLHLNLTESALVLNVAAEGEPKPANVVIERREGDEAWVEYHRSSIPDGRRAWLITSVTAETEVRVLVTPEGDDYCPSRATIGPDLA